MERQRNNLEARRRDEGFINLLEDCIEKLEKVKKIYTRGDIPADDQKIRFKIIAFLQDIQKLDMVSTLTDKEVVLKNNPKEHNKGKIKKSRHRHQSSNKVVDQSLIDVPLQNDFTIEEEKSSKTSCLSVSDLMSRSDLPE